MKFLKAVFLVFLFLCYSVIVSAQNFTLPKDWDDAYITMIKKGQPVKKKIGILDFRGMEKILSNAKAEVKFSEYLEAELKNTNRFDIEIIDSAMVKKIESESDKFKLTDANDDFTIKIGEAAGVNYLVVGVVNSASHTYTKKFAYDVITVKVGITVKLIDINSKKVILSKSSDGTVQQKIISASSGTTVRSPGDLNNDYVEASKQAISSVSGLIAQNYVLVGSVVSSKENDVIINIGSSDGVTANMKFLVIKPKIPILNPSTQEVIGYEKNFTALLKVKSVESKLTKCKVSDYSDNYKKVDADDIVVMIKEEN